MSTNYVKDDIFGSSNRVATLTPNLKKPKVSFGKTQAKHFLGYWKGRTFLAFCVRTKMTLYDVRSQEHAWLFNAQKGEKPSMFLASDVIKLHFGAHTESQESSLLPVAKKVLGLCLAKRRL